jgi:hypothetical protein
VSGGVRERPRKIGEVAEGIGVTPQDCRRSRWESSTDDAERACIMRASIPHVERQLQLVRARRRSVDEFADELAAKLERMRRCLDELQASS